MASSRTLLAERVELLHRLAASFPPTVSSFGATGAFRMANAVTNVGMAPSNATRKSSYPGRKQCSNTTSVVLSPVPRSTSSSGTPVVNASVTQVTRTL